MKLVTPEWPTHEEEGILPVALRDAYERALDVADLFDAEVDWEDREREVRDVLGL